MQARVKLKTAGTQLKKKFNVTSAQKGGMKFQDFAGGSIGSYTKESSGAQSKKKHRRMVMSGIQRGYNDGTDDTFGGNPSLMMSHGQ